MNITPIQKSSAASKVFDALHEMIVAGKFKTGEKLPPQEELARQMGVSRNTLREAINRLSAMGFLQLYQGVGTLVEPAHPNRYLSTLGSQFLLDTLSVREFIEARIALERVSVHLTVQRAAEKDFEILYAAITEQRKALKNGDFQEFTRQDAFFHLTLSQISENRVLMKFTQTIQDMLHRFIGEVVKLPGAMEDAIRFHTIITKAIVARDTELAEIQMVKHLFDVVRRIESNLGTDLEEESLLGFDLLGSQKGKKPGAQRKP
jgi:GntR family transcriptional regulator, transcriptional repressor for pyruvate dehydrogenase complex